MDRSCGMLAVILLACIPDNSEADFSFNRPTHKMRPDQICKPGRTVMKMGSKDNWNPADFYGEDDEDFFAPNEAVEPEDDTNEIETLKGTTNKKRKPFPKKMTSSRSKKIQDKEHSPAENNNEVETHKKPNKIRNPIFQKKRRPRNDQKEKPEEVLPTRRVDDTDCYVCVCSTDGKDEYCAKRPARNFYECIEPNVNKLTSPDIPLYPFEMDERVLAYRIRRGGKNLANIECIPFKSEYSDCTQENLCSGCVKCTCLINGVWSCKDVHECNDEESSDEDSHSDNDLDNALSMLKTVLEENNEQPNSPYGYIIQIRKH